jgi:hypothetical protein
MGIIELLQKVGEENVRVQNLLDSATNFSLRKSGVTAITLLTKEIRPEAALGMGNTI